LNIEYHQKSSETATDRLPLITENIETELYEYIKNKCHALECQLHAIGGISEHIHSSTIACFLSALLHRTKKSSSKACRIRPPQGF
jgi:REP element-mobilizing transposase RayT